MRVLHVIGCERRYLLNYCYITRNRMQNQKINDMNYTGN
jgi:hypothetical protein